MPALGSQEMERWMHSSARRLRNVRAIQTLAVGAGENVSSKSGRGPLRGDRRSASLDRVQMIRAGLVGLDRDPEMVFQESDQFQRAQHVHQYNAYEYFTGEFPDTGRSGLAQRTLLEIMTTVPD